MSNQKLVPELKRMLETKEVNVSPKEFEAILDTFGDNCKSILKETFSRSRDLRKLRLSAIGKPDRELWMNYNHPERSESHLTSENYMIFLYGHLIEEMMLSLVKLSGNKVTDEQKTVEVEGVTGHMDCKINGVIVDVKSASQKGFTKFKNNTLHKDDPFGYIGQNKCYAYAEEESKYGWLAFNKVSGEIAYLEYDEDNPGDYKDAIDWDPAQRVLDVKKFVANPEPPEEFCALPIDSGASGNQELAIKCAYCPHKFECYPKVRSFAYKQGTKYLTTVVKMPRVSEVTDDEL